MDDKLLSSLSFTKVARTKVKMFDLYQKMTKEDKKTQAITFPDSYLYTSFFQAAQIGLVDA